MDTYTQTTHFTVTFEADLHLQDIFKIYHCVKLVQLY